MLGSENAEQAAHFLIEDALNASSHELPSASYRESSFFLCIDRGQVRLRNHRTCLGSHGLLVTELGFQTQGFLLSRPLFSPPSTPDLMRMALVPGRLD
jgi:hypothetical protein